jgi:putative acetyltransferase
MNPLTKNMIIRTESQADYPAVYSVNTSAFETQAEANLVETLRKEAFPYISLVAEEQGEVVGHILFTPVNLSGHEDLKIMGLAPLAVKSVWQGKGIGAALVKAGLHRCEELGYGACVVLGHPTYYPRFGFVPSVNFGISSDYDVPPEVFMAVELEPGYLQGAAGTIHFHPAFNGI